MLATTLGIPFDADKNWDEREQQYKMSGDIVKTRIEETGQEASALRQYIAAS